MVKTYKVGLIRELPGVTSSILLDINATDEETAAMAAADLMPGWTVAMVETA